MLVTGLTLLAISIIALWLCLPGKDSQKKSFLRGGADVLAGVAITAGLGIAGAMIVIGLGR